MQNQNFINNANQNTEIEAQFKTYEMPKVDTYQECEIANAVQALGFSSITI